MLTVVVGDPAALDLHVVLLHGYAMSPEDLAPFARSLGVTGQFHFPQGLLTLPGGGHAWWPIDEAHRAHVLAQGPRDLSLESPQDRAPARAALAHLLRELRTRSPGARLVLAGFSQGGMLACDTLLHEDVMADGLALFSSSRIALNDWQARASRLSGLPALVAHGTNDADLSFAAGESLYRWLRDAGTRAQWLAFDGGHEMPLPVWRAFRTFLRTLPSAQRG